MNLDKIRGYEGEIRMATITLNKVKTIKTLNNIAEKGLNVFDQENYLIDDNSNNPDAIVLRSFNMHDLEFGDN